MPVIGKQRRANRSISFRTRRDRFAGNSKLKPFTLSGKLKSNNHYLAKALSEQKQENQLLFIEKIELTRQVQTLTTACNKRDLVFSNVQKNAKEMLTMLVTMTNFVTNTIMCCQEFIHKPDGNTSSRPSSASTTRRDSTRRLSTKSPARGVVKPMVSGHTITKPTINLRRVNLQRVQNVLDLSAIIESSPESNNNTINTSRVQTVAAFNGANRLGYEGERRRRLPERIPVDYVQANDEERESLDRQEPRLSSAARFSGHRLSNGPSRKRSGNSLLAQIRSPSVSLCDVSKLLQNSQTINVRMLEDSQGNQDFSRLSNSIQNFSRTINDENRSDINLTVQEGSDTLEETLQSHETVKKVETKKTTKTEKKKTNTNRNVEIDPMEGPSWLLNGTVLDPSVEEEEESEEEEKTIEIFRRKHISKKLESSESENEEENNPDDDSMEFTECVNGIRKASDMLIPKAVGRQNHVTFDLRNRVEPNRIIEHNKLNDKDLDDLLNNSDDPDEQCVNIHSMDRSNEFVTDRRRQYVADDDEDDDTIMLKMARGAKTAKFDINDLRLPVVSCPILTPAEPSDSEPEVTTTIKIIPQSYMPANLPDDNVRDRLSNFCSLQLPKIDDELMKMKSAKRTVKRKKTKNNKKSYEADDCCSDSDNSEVKSKKKTKKPTNNVKDTSLSKTALALRASNYPSAKVVLEKLNDTQMRNNKSMDNEQSIPDKTPDSDSMSERTSEAALSVTDSNSSTHSVSERSVTRPRRQKAPTNLKEPNIHTKMRR